MKIFWVDEKKYRNQQSPWHDRRLGEIAIRYIHGDYMPGRVQHHISSRLVKHLRRMGSPMGKVYLNQGKSS